MAFEKLHELIREKLIASNKEADAIAEAKITMTPKGTKKPGKSVPEKETFADEDIYHVQGIGRVKKSQLHHFPDYTSTLLRKGGSDEK